MLANEPYCYRKEEILVLDPWWITNVILFPRDEKTGMPKTGRQAAKMKTPRERYFEQMRARGLTDDVIAEEFAKAEATNVEIAAKAKAAALEAIEKKRKKKR